MLLFSISTWSLVSSFFGSFSRKNANLLATLKGRFKKYLLISNSFKIKVNISLKVRISGPPTSKTCPLLNFLLTQLTIIFIKSETKIGWNLVFHPPIIGKKGENFAYCAKKLIKLSSSPKTMDGLKIKEFLIFFIFFLLKILSEHI